MQKHFPAGRRAGRPRVRSAPNMINATFYVQAMGCQWRAILKDYPPWKQVYSTSPAQRVGRAAGAAAPAGSAPRQAGQAQQRGHHRLPIAQDRLKRRQRGYDTGKRIKGRKRRIASDTRGCCWPWWRLQQVFRTRWEPGLCWCGCSCALSV